MSSVPHDFNQLPFDPGFAPPRKRLSRRAKWDLALVLAGVGYIMVTLAMSLDAPLLSILFIALVVREWISGRER